MRLKPLPKLSRSLDAPALPWRVVAQGCDTYAETWDVEFTREARQAMEAAKARAIELDPRAKDGVALDLGGEEWRIMPHGAKGGVVYVLASPEMLVMVRSFSTDWCVTVRYLSAALWQWNLGPLRARADAFLREVSKVKDTKDNPRVTRLDHAIDIHCPGFAPRYAMCDDWVFPQGSAKMRVHGSLACMGRSGAPQTFTLGRIDGLQLQLYDKCAEIREASGKDWFSQIWGGVSSDVWRVEARFGGAWLKERGLRTFEAVRDTMPELLATALTSYRLTDGSASRARRAAVHPLWQRAIDAAPKASFGVAVENLTTMKRPEFRAMMVRNVAGTIRAAIVAHDRDVTPALVEILVSEAIATERQDRNRNRKIAKLEERHRWIERPA
jgi:hypothetical protein